MALTDDARDSINAAMDQIDTARNDVGLYTAAQRWPQVRSSLTRLANAVECVQLVMDNAGLPVTESASAVRRLQELENIVVDHIHGDWCECDTAECFACKAKRLIGPAMYPAHQLVDALAPGPADFA